MCTFAASEAIQAIVPRVAAATAGDHKVNDPRIVENSFFPLGPSEIKTADRKFVALAAGGLVTQPGLGSQKHRRAGTATRTSPEVSHLGTKRSDDPSGRWRRHRPRSSTEHGGHVELFLRASGHNDGETQTPMGREGGERSGVCLHECVSVRSSRTRCFLI